MVRKWNTEIFIFNVKDGVILFSAKSGFN